MFEKNEACPCKRIKCERHGNCKACREHHKNKKMPNACDRIKLKEEKRKNSK